MDTLPKVQDVDVDSTASFNAVALPEQGMGQAQLADFLPVVHYRVIAVEFRDRMGDGHPCPLRVSSRAAEADWIEGHWRLSPQRN